MSNFVVRKEQKFNDYTLLTYYSQSRNEYKKNIVPFIDTEDGFLKRLNLETGEIFLYTRDVIVKSKCASITRSRIKLIQLLNMNSFDWFITLTFSSDVVDRLSESEVYIEYKNFIKRLQYIEPDVKYITVIERHKKDGAIHYHILLGNIDYRNLRLTNSGKVCCSWANRTNYIADVKKYNKEYKEHLLTVTDGQPVFNLNMWHSGFSTATLIQDKARTNFYVMKYIQKSLGTTNRSMHRFYYSKNLELPVEKFELFVEKYDKQHEGYKISNSKDILSLVKLYDYSYLKSCDFINSIDEVDVVQMKISNFAKDMIDSGYIPIDDNEIDFNV